MKNLTYNVNSTIRLTVRGTLKYDSDNNNKFSISYIDDNDEEVIEEADKFLKDFLDTNMTLIVEMRNSADTTDEFVSNINND